MCEPATIIMGVTAVISAYSANKNAKDQAENMGNAQDAQADQKHAADSVAAGERVKQGNAERSRLRVAAGESNVAGQSFEAEMMDSAMQQDQDIGVIELNTANASAAQAAQLSTAFSNVNNPSLVESGLQIGGAVYSAQQQSKAVVPTSE